MFSSYFTNKKKPNFRSTDFDVIHKTKNNYSNQIIFLKQNIITSHSFYYLAF